MSPADIPEGSIVITPTEVYNEVKSLTDAVRDLIASDKADEQARADLRIKVDRHKVETDARFEKFDVRLTAVEKKMLLFTGAAAALGAGVGTWLPGLLG